MARVAQFLQSALTLILLLSSCTSPVKDVTGQVLDAASGQPLPGVLVTLAEGRQITGPDGRFSFRNVEAGGRIATSACAYDSKSLSVPNDGGVLNIELTPLPVQGHVSSALTGEGLVAELSIEKTGTVELVTATSDKEGDFRIVGACPGDVMSVKATGYEEAMAVPIPESRQVLVPLLGDPKTTFEQVRRWEANGQYRKAYDYLHPDIKKFLTLKEFAEDWKIYVREGYQPISVDVKEVNIISSWVHPKCEFADFGPKRYEGVAALRAVYHDSAPEGGERTYRGIAHMVKANDSWRFFSKVECWYKN